MGSKTHKQSKRFSAADLAQRVRRSLEKQDFKQAHKDAKVCYQQEPTEAHRHLLERAWFSRAMMQQRAGLAAESRESAQGLLDFGVTDPEIRRQLPELLVGAGLLDRAIGGQGGLQVELRPELLAAAADRAVASPQTAPRSLPEIAAGAGQVRASLEALYRGEDTAALDSLKNIPRSSPFADWRWFVRGLSAYYQGQIGEAGSYWERLEPGRLAAKIAASLRSLADSGPQGPTSEAHSAMRVLEKAIAGESLTASLWDLPKHLSEGDFRAALGVLRRYRPAMLRVAPEFLGRVERLLCARFIHDGDVRAFRELTKLASAPPMDPHWNRAWAMLNEHPEQGNIEEAIRFWRQYIADLSNLDALDTSQPAMAQALVWLRIGRMHAEWAEDDSDWDEEDEDELEDEDRTAAVSAFGEAIRLAPELLSAHESLADAYRRRNRDELAAGVYRRLLERFPDHLDALQFLFSHHMKSGEPIAARDYALRAQRLKPANPEIVKMVWMGHVASARHYALEGKFDLGRAEFAAAECIDSGDAEPFHLLARKAVFELKAGETELGRRLAEETKGLLEDPAPAVLVLLIEATRFHLPLQLGGIMAEWELEWRRALTGKRSAKAAGRLGSLMLGFLIGGTEYPGRETHLQQVFNYVKRSGRVRWDGASLRNVCLFLDAMARERRHRGATALLKTRLAQGLKKFPEIPDFPFLAGRQEMDKGPMMCDRRLARRYFEQARDLAAKSGPKYTALKEQAERQLTFLAEVGECSFGPSMLGGGGPFDDGDDDDGEIGPPMPREIFAAFTAMCESLGLDSEEALDEVINGGGPFGFSPQGRRGASERSPAEGRNRKATKRNR